MRRDAIIRAPGSACAPKPADLGPVQARTGGRRPGVPLPGRGPMVLLALAAIGLVGPPEDDPGRERFHGRIVTGEPGLLTIGFALSPDGRTAATVSSDGRVSLRAIREDGGIEQSLDPRPGQSLGLAFSPDGRLLAAGR